MKKIIIIFLFCFLAVSGQETNPNRLIQLVKDNFLTIEDYSVDVTISVDISILKAPTTNAKIFFKQPNKVKIKSDGFAIIPKQGLNFFPTELLESDYTALYIKSDVFNNFQVDVIKVVPMSDTSDIILTTLWIDPLIKVIRKIEMNTKSIGMVDVELRYNDPIERVLPSEAKFTFQTGKSNSDSPDEPKDKKRKGFSSQKISGTAIIKYSNYKINQGISDSIFEKE